LEPQPQDLHSRSGSNRLLHSLLRLWGLVLASLALERRLERRTLPRGPTVLDVEVPIAV
jgi:hypothetical protein